MSGSYLLDTSIVIALFHKETTALEHARKADEIFISSTVLGELYYGAVQALRVEENLRQIESFLAGATILSCDGDSAREYARIKNELRVKGRMIPENDIWIAAVARQHSLMLIARDQHFRSVEDLHLTFW